VDSLYEEQLKKRMTPDEWKEYQRYKKKNDNILKRLANNPDWAQLKVNEINYDKIFDAEIFTGNSETYFKLGVRHKILSEISSLKRVLELDTPIEVITHLSNIAKEVKE
jgi:hypothetical protein